MPEESLKRTEVKRRLGEIVERASNGETVHVLNGLKGKKPGSSFVPLASLKDTHHRQRQEVEAQSLRVRWSGFREEVENTGVTLIVTRKGVPACALIAARYSLEKKVPRARQNLGATPIVALDDVMAQIERLRADVDDLTEALRGVTGEGGVPSLIGIAEQMLRDWRVSKGYSPIPVIPVSTG